jgi:hypothetical protein
MDAVRSTNALATFVNTQIERGRRVLTTSEACYARLDARAIAYAGQGVRERPALELAAHLLRL